MQFSINTFTPTQRCINIKPDNYSDIYGWSKFTRRTSLRAVQRSLGNSVWWWIHWCSSKSRLLLSRFRVRNVYGFLFENVFGTVRLIGEQAYAETSTETLMHILCEKCSSSQFTGSNIVLVTFSTHVHLFPLFKGATAAIVVPLLRSY